VPSTSESAAFRVLGRFLLARYDLGRAAAGAVEAAAASVYVERIGDVLPFAAAAPPKGAAKAERGR
jgi:hypothetical protein